jgi:hypothetical protein
MAGDEYYRQVAAEFLQAGLQLETTEAGHSDVQYQAARAIRRIGLEKLVGRMKSFTGLAHGSHEQFHGMANCRVVVDYEYGWPTPH